MKPSLKPRFDAEPSWKWRDAPAVSSLQKCIDANETKHR